MSLYMLAQLKQEDLKIAKPDPGGAGGAGGGGGAYEAAAKAAQEQIKALALLNLQETTAATIESMKVSHASQMTSLFLGMMTEAESQLIKTAQTFLQLAGQAHALISAGVQ
jgi:hypothetical protein